MSSDLPLASGDLVAGKYRLGRLLGLGEHCAAFAATHEKIRDARIALKIVLPKYAATHGNMMMNRAKQSFLASTPTLSRVMDVGHVNEAFYVVLQHYDGVDLATHLGGARRPTNEIVPRLVEVCEALALLHRFRGVHGEVDATNVFLANEDGEVRTKLHDLGIGPVDHHRAPEKPPEARSDVWSVGVLLGESTPERPDIAAVVAKCTARDPNERYQSMSALIDALKALS